MSVEDAIRDLTDALGELEQAWEDHDCLDDHDCKADEEEAHASGYDEGRAELKKALLDDIETWKRQAGIGLVTGHMLLEDMEAWVKRT